MLGSSNSWTSIQRLGLEVWDRVMLESDAYAEITLIARLRNFEMFHQRLDLDDFP